MTLVSHSLHPCRCLGVEGRDPFKPGFRRDKFSRPLLNVHGNDRLGTTEGGMVICITKWVGHYALPELNGL